MAWLFIGRQYVKQAELISYLKSKGVEIKQGTRHLKLALGTRRSVCVRHPSQEVSPESLKNIKRQLGIK